MTTKTTKLADVANEVVCANCGHLGSAHADGERGQNTGACSMNGCDCGAMVTPQAQAAAAPPAPAPPAPEPIMADLPGLIAAVAADVDTAVSALEPVDLTGAGQEVATFVGLVTAAKAAVDLLAGADPAGQLALAEAVDACLTGATAAGPAIQTPGEEILAAIDAVGSAETGVDAVLAELGAAEPAETTPPPEAAPAMSVRPFGRFADAPVIPEPTPSVDAGVGVTDTNELALAVDVTMDAAFALLEGTDLSLLPPEVAQALSLLRAAESAVDDLLESIGTPDVEDAAAEDAPTPIVADAAPDPVSFSMPIMVIEGVDTGDGRRIEPNALTWRDLPFPVMAITKTTMGHDDAELVGRIDSIERIDLSGLPDSKTGEPFPDGVTALRGRGVFAGIDEAERVAGLIKDQFLTGVSVDIGDVKATVEFLDANGVPVPEDGDEGLIPLDGEIRETLTAGRVHGVTICPFPAFEGAFIELDDGTTTPQTREPEPAIAASVGSIFYTDEPHSRECVPCESGETLTASAGPIAPPAAWFEDPHLEELTRPTITDDGRFYGHLAPWGVCHIGIAGKCVLAPHSRTGYAHFRTKATVTAEGDLVPTGVVTLGGGHADLPLSRSEAIAHYDESGFGVADIATGEDRHGIWFSGAIRPDVTEEQIRRLRGSALSGDWRAAGGGVELIAALAVNTGGFPIVKAMVASGATTALVAAGARQVMLAAHGRAVDDNDDEQLVEMRAQWPLVKGLLKERSNRAAVLRSNVKAGRLRRAVHSK